jgi:hypothetical protein
MTTSITHLGAVGAHHLLPEWQRTSASLCEKAMLSLLGGSKGSRARILCGFPGPQTAGFTCTAIHTRMACYS